MDYSRPKECYQGNGGEFCFNARATDYLTFIDRIAAHAAAIKGVPAYASMRFMRHTDAYLGMQRFPVTVSVEIGCLQPWPRSDEFLAKVSADALALGGVPHWGQSSAVRNSRASYGTALDYFHYAVARTEEGQAATFSSAFSRSNDLDPPASLAALTATIGGAVSLKAVLQGAEAKFMLPPKSTTLGSVARAFVPSLRMRAADVATTSGRAAVMTPTQIRLRDVAARVL
jgi:hypothetical protein